MMEGSSITEVVCFRYDANQKVYVPYSSIWLKHILVEHLKTFLHPKSSVRKSSLKKL